MTSSNETAEKLAQEELGEATTVVLSSDGFTLALISLTLFTKYLKKSIAIIKWAPVEVMVKQDSEWYQKQLWGFSYSDLQDQKNT